MKRKSVRIGIIIGVALLFLTFAAGGGYAGRHLYIKNIGIHIYPQKDCVPYDVAHYLQNDAAWKNESIGYSSYSMGGSGCLISSAATSMEALGISITPKELNDRLTAVDGYEGADLLWYKISEAVPGVQYRYSRFFSGKTIDSDLAAGFLPIVEVSYYKTGVKHWVLIIGAKNGEYLISDPLNPEKAPMPLSTHGKVYAYRVLYLEED